MTAEASRTRRPPVAARRLGYVLGLVANTVVLVLVHVAPGWRAVPFLTEDAAGIVALFTVSVVVSIVVDVLYLAYDEAWFVALGQLVTTAFGFAVLVRLFQVFPFAFGPAAVDWALVVRVALVLSMVGTTIGALVQVVRLVRAGYRRS